jgi:hypothetical protein
MKRLASVEIVGVTFILGISFLIGWGMSSIDRHSWWGLPIAFALAYCWGYCATRGLYDYLNHRARSHRD